MWDPFKTSRLRVSFVDALIRWMSGVSRVRTPTPAYNNALSYQLSYAHGTYLFSPYIKEIPIFFKNKKQKIFNFSLYFNNLFLVQTLHFIYMFVYLLPFNGNIWFCWVQIFAQGNNPFPATIFYTCAKQIYFFIKSPFS